jgi:proton glutamate symport protein
MLRRLLGIPLHVQIFAALAAAVAAGLATGVAPAPHQETALNVYRFLGTLFLNALKMITLPLVMSAVMSGLANLGSGRAFGRLGLKTLGYFLSTTLLAVLAGLLVVNLIQPGLIDGQPARDRIGLSADTESVRASVGDRSLRDVSDVFLRMIPTNVFAAAAEGDMLGAVVFSLLFGYFITRLPGAAAGPLTTLIQTVFDVMMRLTDFILRFAPLGVFGLVARVVATTGLESWRPLALFFATVMAGLAIHALLTLPLLLLLVGRVKPWRHARAMAPALLTAFSTSSSSATVPISLDCAEKRAGVSNRVSSFVIPLGATVNMDGTALYECVAALFIAQAYGLEITLGVQFTVVVLALLTSIGVAGIPSASLVAIVLILQNIGLPVEGIGLILATDRILDMCRTSINVFGDTSGAVIIARSEGEQNVLGGAV